MQETLYSITKSRLWSSLLPEVRLTLQRQTRSNRSHSKISRMLEEEADKEEGEGDMSVHCAVDESCRGLCRKDCRRTLAIRVRIRAVMALTPREVLSKAKPSAIFPSQRHSLACPSSGWCPPAAQKPMLDSNIEGTISKGIRD
ncbi:hypothetical protein ALC62_00601 [Cyphomyrmex costatus]|uniref:Uncharacterized protein n=1 Tax=Cyphomyrmex costatus TaxID=456900 RepID=A0A151IQG4_9HYME|nr:hypothetical protein ALC62_00601 [Cyphomyrmex costatus]